jgi:nicotinamidase-related amidase
MTDLMDAGACALVLVDYQQRLMPAIVNAEDVVAQAIRLADVARVLEIPVLGTEQNPAGLGPNVAAIRERCVETLAKVHFGACADGLVERLRVQRGAALRQVVIAGCETHVCLLQTALGLLEAGLRVWVVAPACGSRFASDRDLALARLRDAGATPVSTEMVAFEWLRSCRQPRFKDVLALLKAAPGTP